MGDMKEELALGKDGMEWYAFEIAQVRFG